MKITLYRATNQDRKTYLYNTEPDRDLYELGEYDSTAGSKLFIGHNIGGQTWDDDPKKIEIDTDHKQVEGEE
jgi:hypothetical protein